MKGNVQQQCEIEEHRALNPSVSQLFKLACVSGQVLL